MTKVSTKPKNYDVQTVKVADKNGSPLMVGGVVTYQCVDSKAYVLGVEYAEQFVQTQALASIKQVANKRLKIVR